MADMLALSPARRAAMGVAARENVRRNFSEATVIAQYRAALTRALADRDERG
jgi:hypothetical protein